jgi:hypothetical protein
VETVSGDAPRIRVRGIYATALTRYFRSSAATVVGASSAIRRRFEEAFPDGPAEVAVETTPDRVGVGVSGARDGVTWTTDHLLELHRDVLTTAAAAPVGAVFDATVGDTLGGGAAVDLGDREGYLPFDAVDGYVDTGDRVRVQVREPAPPWTDRRPELGTGIEVGGDLVTLSRNESGVSARGDRETATELARTTELLSVEVPDDWGIRWEYPATEADMSAMESALSAATEAARDLEGSLASASEGPQRPRRIAAPRATTWVRFGRETRFELDELRRGVTTTMPGHHRIKAAHESASTAVDFVEAVGAPDGEFPFEAVTGQFGPTEGDRVGIAHGKPDGREFSLGRAEVASVEPSGKVRLRREMSGSGEYDGLGTSREPGDEAVTRIKEGRWWYPTVYRGEDGTHKGTYVNVCTPVEVFPDAVRYVDLHVDVVKRPDGEIERVDDDELDRAVEEGPIPEPLAARAREVAGSIENAL